MQTEAGKQYLFVAIDRTSKRAFADLHAQATQAIAVAFLERVLARVPYRISKMLTDNGVQFRNLPHHSPPWAGTRLGSAATRTALSSASPSRPTPGPTARSNG